MPMDLRWGGMKPIVYKEGWLWVVRKGSLVLSASTWDAAMELMWPWPGVFWPLARPRRNASVGVVATGHLAGIDAGVRPI
jgi:hypothetical protein